MSGGTTALEQLMAAGGLDPPITEAAWRDFVEHIVETLDVGPGTRVFDAACGAGALLYPLFENGYLVGGLDPSAAAIEQARRAMPAGRWQVGDASALDPADAWDVVISAGFGRFPNFDHARGVLARMAAKATHAIAILDIPDGSGPGGTGRAVGGLAYERIWFLRALAEIGVTAVQFEEIARLEEAGAPRRFHVFARV